ncbi:MAG: hypothetical protein JW967_06995 [Dehalococcoidales bacterium]|nr:hypothetical protein [Dehalococcoidales bacterium]
MLNNQLPKYIILLLSCSILSFSIACNNVSTTSKSQQPVEVISVKSIGESNPGGPTVEIILKNIGDEPIVSLNTILKLDKAYVFNFSGISYSSPLLHGESSGETRILIGGGYASDTLYPLEIVLILQDGTTLLYTKKVQIE